MSDYMSSCQAPVSSNPNAASSGGGRAAAPVGIAAKALKHEEKTDNT